jgi:hypothetical protein
VRVLSRVREARRFISSVGYDEIVGNACAGDGNPIGEAGTKGGEVLFMWATGKRGEGKRP